jgi:hypothetical protein
MGQALFPSSLTEIGYSAFLNDSKLSTIVFPEGSLLTTIGSAAFLNCDIISLDLTLTQLQSIETETFQENTNIGQALFPSSLTGIGANAFLGDSKLSTIVFPEGSLLTNIYEGAFQNCDIISLDLTSTTKLETIGYGAFNGNINMGRLIIPSSLTTIGEAAFTSCDLTNLDLRKAINLQFIDSYTFSYNFNLTQVLFSQSLSSIGNSAFNNCSSIISITFPDSMSTLGSQVFLFSNPFFSGVAESFSQLSSINVTSNFNQFEIFTEENVGVPSAQMFVYTFGENTNSKTGCEYSTLNLLDPLNIPSDSNTFKAVLNSTPDPLTFPNMDAQFLFPTLSPPENGFLSNVTLYYPGFPAILPTQNDVYTYFNIELGGSVVIQDTGEVLSQDLSGKIRLNGLPSEGISVGQSITINNTSYAYRAQGSALLGGPPPPPPPPPQPCLLKGTFVRTPSCNRPIETIRVGDEIVSHCNLIKKVTRVGVWECTFKDHTLAQTMYKVPAGSYGASRPVFISHFHKISNGHMMLYPKTLGLEKAREEEFVKDGKYTLYHLEVENGTLNHLLVNGFCVVDSWVV